MLNRIFYTILLSTVAGSVFSHTLPLLREKSSEWEQPVVISEQFFPPHPSSHHSAHHIPQNEFKEIIGIQLQRIPFYGGSEHEILQHDKYKKQDILEHHHEPHGFLKHHIPPPILEREHTEHEILSHELPSPDLLDERELEHEHEHHSHEFHNILKSEHSELMHRENERREHEIKVHEDPQDHEIQDLDQHEHKVAGHQIPHAPRHHPPLDDPEFVLSEEEQEHEFHHEELFPEVSRRERNRRREGISREGGSRRNNSNSNRRENSNRRGNSNRRENSNRESSRRNREGSNINPEELFPRRNGQNNNRRNNNNNRRNNNNKEGSRRNSNIEELAALEEEISNHEVSNSEISRPERDVSFYDHSDRRETYDSSFPKQDDSIFSNLQTSSQLINNFEAIQQQSFIPESNAGRHSDSEKSRKFTNEQLFSESWPQRPTLTNLNNKEYSNSGVLSDSNINQYTNSISGTRRPNQPSGNIFVREEEYLTLDGLGSQPSSLRPTGSIYNINNGQSWSPQDDLTGSSQPIQSNAFSSSRPEELSIGGSSRPGYLGSRPGSGKPLLQGSLSGHESLKPNRPGSSSSGFHSYEEERPNRPSGLQEERPERPSSGFSESHLHQEGRPNRPGGSSSGFHSYEEERPNRPSSSSFGLQEEKPGRPSSGFPESHSHQGERPNRPSSNSFGLQEERPGRPSSGFPESHSHHRERPNRPNSNSFGLQEESPGRPSSGFPESHSHQGERPNRPNSNSFGLQEERPGRPSSGFPESHSHQGERPNRPNSNSFGFQEERPGRPSNGFPESHSHQGERPNRPSSNSFGLQEERPGRPSSGISESHSHQGERPNRTGGSSFSGFHSYQEERPKRPSSSASGLSYQEERPGQPNSGTSGPLLNQEERPNRPSPSSVENFSNQGTSKPSRPSSSHSNSQGHSFHEESLRPQRPSSRPGEGNSRPRPTNGNNLSNATDLISVQEDSWFWPNQSEDEDKKKRRADSDGNQKLSSTTKKPSKSDGNNKKHHVNLKLLPTDSCGVDLGNKIIGGENTQLDEFPWMALLQHSSTDGRALGFGCGGSLISSRYVLTAAHCIKGPAIGNNIRVTKVRLGEFDVSSDVDCQGEICSPPPVDIPVEEIIVHPKYRATDRAQLNDIALIRLRENAKTSGYISPICLPLNGNNDHVGEKLTVAGWGKTSNGQKGASSKTKQKVSIPVVTLEECSPFYNRINIQLNNTQMCAGGERGKDSCQGDSGGPLMSSEVIDSQIRWQVHGIVSFGPEDCGIDNVAGVYTKVSEYIDWILDNMKK